MTVIDEKTRSAFAVRMSSLDIFFDDAIVLPSRQTMVLSSSKPTNRSPSPSKARAAIAFSLKKKLLPDPLAGKMRNLPLSGTSLPVGVPPYARG